MSQLDLYPRWDLMVASDGLMMFLLTSRMGSSLNHVAV